jgi:hypothetical protein
VGALAATGVDPIPFVEANQGLGNRKDLQIWGAFVGCIRQVRGQIVYGRTSCLLDIQKEHSMAMAWLTALKVVPWGDVIEHAPNVLKAARKLMERQKTEPAPKADTDMDMAGQSVPSLGELQNRWIAAQVQLDDHAQMQAQLTETLAALAEQNAQLVSAVEVLRRRTRLLVWGMAALVVAVLYSGWR